MHGRWWRWLGTVLAVVSGLVFGWVAGSGLVNAAPVVATDAVMRSPVQPPAASAPSDQASALARCSSARFQPSSASALR
jgi:hypothetical protein